MVKNVKIKKIKKKIMNNYHIVNGNQKNRLRELKNKRR
jgi:hypothetical protein